MYFPGCPHSEEVYEHLAHLAEGRHDLHVRRQLVGTPEQTEQYGLHGSPTILIDGQDAFPSSRAPISWSCRMYETEEGLRGAPSLTMLREAFDLD